MQNNKRGPIRKNDPQIINKYTKKTRMSNISIKNLI
jgi:hypothetical protein